MTPPPEPVGDNQIASSFMMYGAREVIDTGAHHINQQVSAIESAIKENNPGLVIDFSNSLIETA